jgi:hypothetical protein
MQVSHQRQTVALGDDDLLHRRLGVKQLAGVRQQLQRVLVSIVVWVGGWFGWLVGGRDEQGRIHTSIIATRIDLDGRGDRPPLLTLMCRGSPFLKCSRRAITCHVTSKSKSNRFGYVMRLTID